MKDKFVYLTTDYEKELNSVEIPFSEYPRPQLKRDSYLCLNGEWDFRIENGETVVYDGKITVPFVPESRISGVMRDIKKDDKLVYERVFTIDKDFMLDRLLIHIGACDQYAEVFVNGTFVGENVGGYLPFSFDITEYACLGENKLKIIARDPMDTELPYGKQTVKRGGMWYTKISGIWQTVWIESVPADYIKGLRLDTDLAGVDITVFGGENEKTIVFNGKEYRFNGNKFRLDVENPIFWTPDNPHLYELEIISGGDRVSSYFGLRTVGITETNGRKYIALNGKPFFFHGLLDQGYFSDGIFLPSSEKGYSDDVLNMKRCGFNMLRKHIKTEPDLFYYYCDKYGMAVFQDMINSGKYSFLIDTALPTVFLKKGITHKATERRKSEFDKTAKGIIDNLYNHPSVVYYTIFNEGWGQFSADENYRKLKSLDPSRIFDTTSGWFKAKETDVESEHVYWKPIKPVSAEKRPLVLSEFGGYSYKVEGHSFNLSDNYGYKTFKSLPELSSVLVSLYENEIIPAIEAGLCATVLTQLSDVEDETNGLMTYDRKVLKVDEVEFKKLSEKLYSVFQKSISEQKNNCIPFGIMI